LSNIVYQHNAESQGAKERDKYMAAPQCNHCGKTLYDWVGNIMVDAHEYLEYRVISDLQVICKYCTRRLDQTEKGDRYHNFWELKSIKDEPLIRMGRVLASFINGQKIDLIWGTESAKKLCFLVALTQPYKDAQNLLRYLIAEEANVDGKYVKALDDMYDENEK
jgi:hypothetical protein